MGVSMNSAWWRHKGRHSEQTEHKIRAGAGPLPDDGDAGGMVMAMANEMVLTLPVERLYILVCCFRFSLGSCGS